MVLLITITLLIKRAVYFELNLCLVYQHFILVFKHQLLQYFEALNTYYFHLLFFFIFLFFIFCISITRLERADLSINN